MFFLKDWQDPGRPQLCPLISLGATEVAEGKETALSSKHQGCGCHWCSGKATQETSTNSEISESASSSLGRALGCDLLGLTCPQKIWCPWVLSPGGDGGHVYLLQEQELGAGFQLFLPCIVQESAVWQTGLPLSRSLQTPLQGVQISRLWQILGFFTLF